LCKPGGDVIKGGKFYKDLVAKQMANTLRPVVQDTVEVPVEVE